MVDGKKAFHDNSPVAIGGVGGSGTRIVAEFLREFKYYIGSDLNQANDNLWFTVMFKRPKWFQRNIQNEEYYWQGLTGYVKLMTGGRITYNDYKFWSRNGDVLA